MNVSHLVLAVLLGPLLSGGLALQAISIAAFALVSVFFAVVNVAVLSIAYRELVLWLADDYGWDKLDAYVFLT